MVYDTVSDIINLKVNLNFVCIVQTIGVAGIHKSWEGI
jgi:hypothetical protein